MMRRLQKQFIYGSVYLGILALITFGIYQAFLKPAPSCFDKIKNQTEEGVDCGLICGNICLPADLRPIVATSIQAFYPGGGRVVILVKVQNANPTLATRRFGYAIEVLADDDSVIRAFDGSSYLYGGEIRYVTEYVSDAEVPRGSRLRFRVTPPEWTLASSFTKPELVLQDRRTDISSTTIQVTGRLLQKDTISLPSIGILAIFHSNGFLGSIIGASETELNNVAPGESRSFAIMHPPLETIDPLKTEVIPFAKRPQ